MRRRRFVIAAAAFGLVAAALVYRAVPVDQLPVSFLRRVPGATGPLALRGGLVAHYRVANDVFDRDLVLGNMRTRVDSMGTGGWVAWVRSTNYLEVVVPGVAEDQLPDYRSALIRNGKLEFRLALAGSPVMRALCAAVPLDPDAGRAGVTAEVDIWSAGDSGEQRSDCFLAAADEASLRAYLRDLLQAQPGLAPPAWQEILFETIAARPEDGAPARVRTYLAERRVEIGNGDIADAEVTMNPYMGRPEVLVTFTRDAGRHFGDLTATHVGDKLLILLEGEVTSAPVIQTAIRGGRSTITLGAGDPDKVEADARLLVAALRAGQLDVPLVEHGVEYVAPSATPGQLAAMRGLFAGLIGLGLAIALLIGRRLGAAALGPPPAGARLPAARWPWLRLAVTAAVVLVIWKLTPRVVLPTLSQDARDQLTVIRGQPFSVFELGVAPVLLAFVLVELAALVVPRWRRLRHAGPAGRAALGPAVLVVTVVLTAVQGWMLASYLGSIGWLDRAVPAAVPVTVISLVGGVLILVVLAWAADRWGLGSGWATIMLVQVVTELALWRDRIHLPGMEVGAGAVVVAGVATVATVLVTLAVVRGPRSGDRRPFVRAPAAGWVPITGALTLIYLASYSVGVGFLQPPRWLADLLSDPDARLQGRDPGIHLFFASPARFVLSLTAITALALLFAWIYARPSLWRGYRQRLRGGAPVDAAAERRAFAVATARGGVWALAVALIFYGFCRRAPEALLPLSLGLLAPVIVVDLVAEWRARARHPDLIAVWPLHQVQLADEVARVLDGEGIAVHLRGLRYRSMMCFFGPEVPIAVMVPVADAERAHRLLAERLTPH